MEKLIAQWIDHLNCCFKSLHTIRNYQADVKQFLQCAAEKGFDPLQLDRPKAWLYFGFLAGRYAKHSTIMRKRDSVKQFYNFLVAVRHISRNEFEFFDRMKKQVNFPAVLTQTDAATLLNSIAPNPALMEITRTDEAEFLACRDRAMLETIYGTGLRAEETANLNWRDIDFRAAFIRVNQGKGGKDRIFQSPRPRLSHFGTMASNTTSASRRNRPA